MKLVTWYEYTNLLDKLYDEIRLRTFDSVVGIGRGGSLVAAYMSSKLAAFLLAGKKVVCVVGAGHVPGIYERMSKLISGGWGMRFDYQVGD